MKKPTLWQRLRLWQLRDHAKDLRRLAKHCRDAADACLDDEAQYLARLEVVQAKLEALENETGVVK